MQRWSDRGFDFSAMPSLFPLALFFALLGVTGWFSYQSYREVHSMAHGMTRQGKSERTSAGGRRRGLATGKSKRPSESRASQSQE